MAHDSFAHDLLAQARAGALGLEGPQVSTRVRVLRVVEPESPTGLQDQDFGNAVHCRVFPDYEWMKPGMADGHLALHAQPYSLSPTRISSEELEANSVAVSYPQYIDRQKYLFAGGLLLGSSRATKDLATISTRRRSRPAEAHALRRFARGPSPWPPPHRPSVQTGIGFPISIRKSSRSMIPPRRKRGSRSLLTCFDPGPEVSSTGRARTDRQRTYCCEGGRWKRSVAGNHRRAHAPGAEAR